MQADSPCPNLDSLESLIAGFLPAEEQARLTEHLDTCASCQQALERLADSDSAFHLAVTALAHTGHLQEAPLRRVLDDLQEDTLTAPATNVIDRSGWLRWFLGPVESTEFLGQLESYQVERVLGQGGMGIVLKAYQPALKRWVAIKLLAPELERDPVARQRFAREAQAAAAVRHKHVITIHAVSAFKGLPFLVMEYIPGGTLQDFLDIHGPVDWMAAARLGREVAAGLAAAHARGLVHRDIKPSNILLEREAESGDVGVAKISDFGLARALDEARLTRPGIPPGTPMYMSPEQALGETVDSRSDLFSLGSVLYTLCTGREPFASGTLVAVLRQVCETAPQVIGEVNPAVPSWLVSVIERLHAKRPADRFGSAIEVEELLRYNLEHPDRPRLAGPPDMRWRWHKKRMLTATAVVALLLSGGLALSEGMHWTHLLGRSADANGLTLRATLRGHRGPIWSVAFAPDGKSLATGSDDTDVRFWDAATGRQRGTLSGHASAVFAVAFAHSGNFLVSSGGDGTLRLWNAASLTQEHTFHLGNNGRRVRIAPNDRTVAVANNTPDVELWDLESRKPPLRLSGHQGTILAIAFAPDGKSLGTGDASGSIRLWDPNTGTEEANFQGDQLGLRALAFSPDSQTLASAGTGDREVKLWNVATRQRTAAFPSFDRAILTLAFSHDGRLLGAGTREGTVTIWDIRAMEILANVQAHQGAVLSLAFSPDGRTLATVGEDRLGKLWLLERLTASRP